MCFNVDIYKKLYLVVSKKALPNFEFTSYVFKYTNYLSKIAAIPGNVFPSRYSSIAPPPVET